MENYEQLGAFYLGRRYDLAERKLGDELLLYDSKDLTTHAVCVGMTGSGKTGLCLAMLEEAALDGIPAIAIDPKGDLGNLLLAFPELKAEDFLPWIDAGEAARAGLSPEDYAARTAQRWREGLAAWGQPPERIARFRDAAEVTIYTPGSSAGMPLSVLRSFAPPPADLVLDVDAFRERIISTASGLLALLGVTADPVQSREHILIAQLLDRAWREGRELDLGRLIAEIQQPPIAQVGVLDLETFFPTRDRMALAVRLNNLLASPSLAGWLEGEPLSVQRLLYSDQGKPRLSILSLAHLSDAERMFFVTLLLSEVVAWVRRQPGTSSLRAILYMDEVFGYFPPVANPPSKLPMLTLLKQARAYGLGVVLATQNPVDLDYKGLANTGTWLIGRLQTERDKARVLEGLEGASVQAGAAFDRGQMAATLAALGSRVFLMNNVHEDQPVVFQTRWVLSYLRGPLTPLQIKRLMDPRREAAAAAAEAAEEEGEAPAALPSAAAAPLEAVPLVAAESDVPASPAAGKRPRLPEGFDELFLAADEWFPAGERPIYRPLLLGEARLRLIRVQYGVDGWLTRALLAAPDAAGDAARLWSEAVPADEREPLRFEAAPLPGAVFLPLPDALLRGRAAALGAALIDHCYRNEAVVLFHCPDLKLYSRLGESEGDFRIRITQILHERRDTQIERIRMEYAGRAAALGKRLEAAQQRAIREHEAARQRSFDTAVSFGSSLLGALLGRKMASRTNVTRAATSAKQLSRTSQKRSEAARAREQVEGIREELAALDAELNARLEEIRVSQNRPPAVEPLSLRPRKADSQVQRLAVLWVPGRGAAAS